MSLLTHLFALVRALTTERNQLALENVALRQQIIVLKRTVSGAKINESDRVFWILMKRMFKDWKETVQIVKPETVVRWHRQGFRYYWRWKSRAKPGRPPITMSLIFLIKRLSRENVLWGAPRIHKELKLLGHDVPETTVAKYMVRPKPGRSDT